MAPGCTIGVDLGGTKVLVGAVDEQGRVVGSLRREVRGLPLGDLLATLVGAVREVAEAVGEPVAAVGCGIPALVDRATATAVRCVHHPLDGVPFAALVRERLGVPVAVDNDVNCAVLAEARLGAARGARHAVMIALGTGIGGGLVLDGRVYRGADGAAGEIGHMTVDADGPACFGSCPGRGCLEALASGSALERDARAAVAADPRSGLAAAVAAGEEPTGRLVSRLAHEGEPASLALVAGLARGLGAGLSAVVNVFNPEVVVLGGGVMGLGELLLAPAREEMRDRALDPSRSTVRVVAAGLGEEAGMVGAAALAREEAA